MEIPTMTSAQMMEKAGLNWKVLQAPVLFEGNGLSEFDGKRVNYRSDTGAALGIVSPTYKISQNSTNFAFLDSFLGDEIESYVKAGSYIGCPVRIKPASKLQKTNWQELVNVKESIKYPYLIWRQI